MKTIKRHINTTIIGKDTYDLIFEIIDKVVIDSETLEVMGKDKPLKQNATVFVVALLLIEEVNKMYSICEDKKDKDMLKKAIYKLYKIVNGGGNNGRKRNKARNSKKYNKN